MYKHAVDSLGNKLAPSKCYRELDWQVFNDVTLPSWLTSTGTPTLDNMTSSVGACKMTTTAVNGNKVSLQMAWPITVNRFAAIDLRIDGLAFDTDGTNALEFGMCLDTWASKHGIRVYQPASAVALTAQTTSMILNTGGNLTAPLNHRLIGDSNGLGRKSLMLRLIPSEYGGEFYEGDALVNSFSSGAKYVTASAITPSIELTTREAVAHSFSFSRLRIGFWC